MYRVKVKRRMSRKRLLKLLMALGLSKREAVRLRAEFPWKENMELFENFVYYWYHVKNIEHPVYREKFDMAYDAWTRFQLTDGKYVQLASRYWNATKNMMVIDSRKKVRNE